MSSPSPEGSSRTRGAPLVLACLYRKPYAKLSASFFVSLSLRIAALGRRASAILAASLPLMTALSQRRTQISKGRCAVYLLAAPWNIRCYSSNRTARNRKTIQSQCSHLSLRIVVTFVLCRSGRMYFLRISHLLPLLIFPFSLISFPPFFTPMFLLLWSSVTVRELTA